MQHNTIYNKNKKIILKISNKCNIVTVIKYPKYGFKWRNLKWEICTVTSYG